MISVSLEDVVFAVCGLIGLLVAAATALLREELGDVLDRLHLDVDQGRARAAVLLVGFVSGFGVGGLIAVRLLGVHGGFAVLAAMIAGVLGGGLGVAVSAFVRDPDSQAAPSMRELVGRSASVAVAIPAGRFGSVYVKAEGRTHEYSATAVADIGAGAEVTVTGAVGDGLVVAAIEAPPRARVLSDEDHPPRSE